MVRKTAAGPTAMSRGGRSTAAPPTVVSLVFYKKNCIFCLNSEGGKLYMKMLASDEIYNFVVQSFSI
jgi:hypothetical protein